MQNESEEYACCFLTKDFRKILSVNENKDMITYIALFLTRKQNIMQFMIYYYLKQYFISYQHESRECT